jgi:hypothetical protein
MINLASGLMNFGGSSSKTVEEFQKSSALITVFELVKIVVILIMAYLVFGIIKKVFRNEGWSSKYYTSIKRIGWLSVLVLLIEGILLTAKEQFANNVPIEAVLANPANYPEILGQVIFSSPVAWFLVCSFFILADVLRFANEPKTPSDALVGK